MADTTYLVNEIYYSLHGEGVRYGIPHVFVRFSQCNLKCTFCDTEFESHREMTAVEIVAEARRIADEAHKPGSLTDRKIEGAVRVGGYIENGPCRNVILCGGEPLLQVDADLLAVFHDANPDAEPFRDTWFICLETNGTIAVPAGIDWITCSPKVAEHAVKVEFAHELKYVRGAGQGIPRPRARADYYLISPVFDDNRPNPEAIAWCAKLVKQNPAWRLTMQHHKAAFGGIR